MCSETEYQSWRFFLEGISAVHKIIQHCFMFVLGTIANTTSPHHSLSIFFIEWY